MAVREAMNAASVSIPHADTIVAVGSVTSAVQHWLWTVRSDTRLRDAVAKQVGGLDARRAGSKKLAPGDLDLSRFSLGQGGRYRRRRRHHLSAS